MGVDWTLLKGFGLIFPVQKLTEEQREVMGDEFFFDNPEVEFHAQDYYGSWGQDFTPYGFVTWKAETEAVLDTKIGHTPGSLMLYGVYQENDWIKGGAVRPFAVACETDEEMDEDKLVLKQKILDEIKKVDEELATIIETSGVYAQWLFSYFS
uniref:Uncharacterized protein n=1 Tax=Clandestinovirus TaxID=2831644 RepID=A0A8F8KTT5_9VIRU|nr:hypothetical protein KOM_12_259 [Clandestinovirus]